MAYIERCVICGRRHVDDRCDPKHFSAIDAANTRAADAEDRPDDYSGHPGHHRSYGERLADGEAFARGGFAILMLILILWWITPGASGANKAAWPGPFVVLDNLWRAIVQVESGGNARAIGDGGKAVGIVQIHAVCVEDVNRILALTGAAKRYTLADRLSPVRSREMFDIYVAYYGLRWAKQHGVERVPVSVLARIWNGGPRGPERKSTLVYWHKVQRFLEVER